MGIVFMVKILPYTGTTTRFLGTILKPQDIGISYQGTMSLVWVIFVKWKVRVMHLALSLTVLGHNATCTGNDCIVSGQNATIIGERNKEVCTGATRPPPCATEAANHNFFAPTQSLGYHHQLWNNPNQILTQNNNYTPNHGFKFPNSL